MQSFTTLRKSSNADLESETVTLHNADVLDGVTTSDGHIFPNTITSMQKIFLTKGTKDRFSDPVRIEMLSWRFVNLMWKSSEQRWAMACLADEMKLPVCAVGFLYVL